ncbi:MAG: hypothetical protein ACI87E_002150 [Mariniblastus sp.]|jgi:hypothetical protein
MDYTSQSVCEGRENLILAGIDVAGIDVAKFGLLQC